MPNLLSKFSTWYFSKKALPYWGILLIDMSIIFLSGLFVHVLNEGTMNSLTNVVPLLQTFAAYGFFYLIGLRVFRTYSGVIRYSSFIDLQRIALAMLLGTGLILFFRYVTTLDDRYLMPVSNRDLIFTFFLATLWMWSVRVVVKYIFDMSSHSFAAKRVFIYGARGGGIGLAKSMRNSESSNYRLQGFVSHEPEMQGRMLMGVRVYPDDDKLVEVMHVRNAEMLFVSPMQSDVFRKKDELINQLTEAGIRIYMMPSAVEWDGKSDLSLSQLKEVEIEDLLPRQEIKVDMLSVADQLSGNRILITGAAGSIGSEIVRQVATFNPASLILIDQAETPMHDLRLYLKKNHPDIEAHTIVTTICNPVRMEELFKQYEPNYVFHAAAYKHVPMMEDNPGEAIRNNVYGTRVVADLAVKYGVRKFVMISTDKAVNPTNVMGCSKRICEIYVQSLDKAIKEGKMKGVTQFVTTRFGNVLGSNGSVIPLFREQIKQGGPVTVTHPDIIRYFMLIPEACKLVLEAGTMGHGGEIFVFDMGKPVRIADLAKRMILLSGAKHVKIVYTGLRDGEKLYEEMLNDAEVTKPTFHPKIKIAAVREYDYEEARQNEDQLYALSQTADDMEIVRKMKEVVPEFKSQHSKYEALDVASA